MGRHERGGVLLRLTRGPLDSTLVFVSAELAARVAPLSSLTRVPGARPPVAGIALADGAVVTVLDLGGAPVSSSPGGYEPEEDWPVPGSDRAIICNLGGLEVAVTGGTVVATGLFMQGPGDGVLWRSEPVPALDVRALYTQAEAAIWAERASSVRPSDPVGRDDQAPAHPKSIRPTQRPGDPGDMGGSR